MLCQGMENRSSYIDLQDPKSYDQLKQIFMMILTNCTLKAQAIMISLEKIGAINWIKKEFFLSEQEELEQERKENYEQYIEKMEKKEQGKG